MPDLPEFTHHFRVASTELGINSMYDPGVPVWSDRVIIRSVAENISKFDLDLHLTIQNRNSCAEFKPTMFGEFCARANVSRLTEKQIRTLYETLFSHAVNGDANKTVTMEMVSHCRNDFFYWTVANCGLHVSLNGSLDYKHSSFYVLPFLVFACKERCLSDLAMVIVNVEKELEPLSISDCKAANGSRNPSLLESNANAESICNLTVTFDYRHKHVECNVTEMHANNSRIVASIIDKIEGHQEKVFQVVQGGELELNPEPIAVLWRLYELRKPEGVSLDYEKEKNISILFSCWSNSVNANMWIVIAVLDDKFSQPKFWQYLYKEIYEGTVNELNYYDTRLIVRAPGENRKILYSLVNQIDDPIQESMFSIKQETGLLYARIGVEFDREERDTYELVVLAKLAEQPSISATAVVRVCIVDLNDNSPHITLPAPLHLSRYPQGFPVSLNCREQFTKTIFILFAQDADEDPSEDVEFELLEKRYFNSEGSQVASLSYANGGKCFDVELDTSWGEIYSRGFSCCDLVGYQIEMKLRVRDGFSCLIMPYQTSRNVTLRVLIVDSELHMPTSVLVVVLLLLLVANVCCISAQCSRAR